MEEDPAKESLEIGQTAVKNASLLLVASSTSLLLGAAMFIIIVRILGPSTYGIYVLAIAVTSLIGAVGNFGIGNSLTKFASQYTAKKQKDLLNRVFSSGYFVTFFISAAFTITVFVLAGPIANLVIHNTAYTDVIQAASAIIILSILYGIGIDSLVGLGKGKEATIAIISLTAFQAAGSITLALLHYGAMAPVLGLVFGYFISLLYTIWSIFVKSNVKLVLPSKKDIVRLLRFSYRIMLSDFLVNSMKSLIIIVLGIVTTAAIVGNVGVASKTGNIIGVITGAMALPLLSAVSTAFSNVKNKKQIKRFYSTSVYFSFIFITPILITFIVLAKPFSYVAFSGAYSIAPTYIRIFCIGFLLGMVGYFATTFMIGLGRVKQLLKYTFIIDVIELLLIPIMLPQWGGIGAALLLFVVNPVLVDIFFLRILIRDFGVKLGFSKLFRVVIANLLMAIFFLPLFYIFGGNYIGIVIASIVIAAILYPPLLSLTKGATKKDLETIVSVTKKTPVINGIIRKLAAYSMFFSRG